MQNEPISLTGKVAVVTGGSRGIGRAIVLDLARAGADVVVNYFRHGSEGESTAAAAARFGVRALAVRAHMGKAEAIDGLFDTATKAFGGVDILVCNAASGVLRPALENDDRTWQWEMSVNAESVFRCVKAVVPLMDARGGGRIITVTSPGTRRMLPGYAMTGVTKGALDVLTRYLAVELAPKGIIVNAVSPGFIAHGDVEAYRNKTGFDVEAETMRRTPTRRLVTPDEVARCVTYLCTCSGIIGQTIVVDNGFSLAW